MRVSETITIRERISYGFGDLASSMFRKLFSMFLITRIRDAVNDPLMGMIGDRTNTRWGKFRPYLLSGSVPSAIVGILTFTTPDLSENGKLIFVYITYYTDDDGLYARKCTLCFADGWCVRTHTRSTDF
jgi:GPH family glycoside/pentoside/hexuronide:cation symporter